MPNNTYSLRKIVSNFSLSLSLSLRVCKPLEKSDADSKGRPINFRHQYVFEAKTRQNRDRFEEKTFLKNTMFLEQKIDKTGTDSKL